MRRYALFLLAAFLAPALPAGVAQDGPFGTRYDYAFGADGCFRTAHGTSAREPLVLANVQILSIYDEFQRFLGILTAGLGSLFFMGVFMKRVNGAGALAGLLANYAVTIGLDRVAFPGKPHLLLYGTLGMVVSLIVAPIVSAAVGAKGKEKGENVGS